MSLGVRTFGCTFVQEVKGRNPCPLILISPRPGTGSVGATSRVNGLGKGSATIAAPGTLQSVVFAGKEPSLAKAAKEIEKLLWCRPVWRGSRSWPPPPRR
jgi:hypothetical protein